ncbi:hypothetical protein GCM10009828_088000 [Actinoplanes couchii]|uniref:CATRA-Associated Small Protein domain-containing protein n=1 Tax=Actinoplanes couchii TaxID=403638 RepID=A0ABQ3XRD7_9ACTN|nr:hypothetical protein Aco03nite_094820 [Actinoplanes couchii]
MDGHWDTETLEDALAVLGDLPLWMLPTERWNQIGTILDRMERAFTAGDDEELRRATTDLELFGPVRVNRIGTREVDRPDPSITERQNRLVNAIGEALPSTSGRDLGGGDDRVTR